MTQHQLGTLLEKAGNSLLLVGGLSIAAIFVTVMINGHWPEVLKPIQGIAQFISSYVGDAVWLFWVVTFFGPGWLVVALGQKLQRK